MENIQYREQKFCINKYVLSNFTKVGGLTLGPKYSSVLFILEYYENSNFDTN